MALLSRLIPTARFRVGMEPEESPKPRRPPRTNRLQPEQERAIREAIHAGQVGSVEELIERAIAALPPNKPAEAPTSGCTVFEQRRCSAVRRTPPYSTWHTRNTAGRAKRDCTSCQES